jgi:molybdopterin converting factor small subunit
MPVIWVPALLRDLTAGKQQVTVPGQTLRQAIDELEVSHPGIKERLLEADQLRPDISVVVDGTVSHLRLRQPLLENSEVHLLSGISGG